MASEVEEEETLGKPDVASQPLPYFSLEKRKRSQRPSDRDTHWAWQDTPWDTRLEPGASARLPHLIHIKAGTGDIEEDDTEMHK
ncbi:unnamed protein product [Boreogadus saida]